ncbi:uncharacterized protein NPIL_469691 [Nephila pilipes]|uniref:Uncharacterized protein n=1 Tax=Nephila pilipes TaxID=299642 RepID=A0A8X6NFU5_NEPPI|nr:uncharacterized protein NPIL_469691 [Nephila pilipes]
MHREESLLNGLSNFNEWMSIFRTKSFSAMKHIFILMALLNVEMPHLGFREPTYDCEKQMHSQSVTVWTEGLIGSYFFENEGGQAVNVTGARYRERITQFFLPKLDDIVTDDMWF